MYTRWKKEILVLSECTVSPDGASVGGKKQMNLRELFYSRMRSLGIYDLSKGTQSLVCCEIESYLRVRKPLFDEIEWAEEKCSGISCSLERLAQYERMLAIPVKQQIPEEKRREIVQSKWHWPP